MKSLSYFKRRIRSFRFICYLTAFLTAAPTLTVLAPAPVSAQKIDTVQVAAVDFVNRTGVGGDYIGKLASDALVVELKNSDRFDVISRSSIQQAMDELGFKAPLPRSQLLRLGEKVLKGDIGQESAMVEGDVTSLKVRGQPRRADVEIIVRMVDVASGEVTNGAIATGRSQLRIGDNPDDDRLIEEAVNDAAYQAVKTIVDYIIPEATVQNTLGTNEVLLNKGAREGIKRGMKMIVRRKGEIVGKVEVRDVTPNDATASVIHAPKGVKPEDKVRAIFDLPQVKGKGADPVMDDPKPVRAKAPKSTSGSTGMGKSKFWMALLALTGIALIVKGGRGVESVGSVTARAGLAPDIPAPEGGIRIKWNPSKLANGRNVVEYHIWRDEIIPVGVIAPSGIDFFIDDVGAATRAVSYSLVNPLLNTESTASGSVNRPRPGTHYRYYVSAVYRIEKPPGTGTWKYFETDKSDTGYATVLRRMLFDDLLEPAATTTGINPVEGITFRFNGLLGADQYVVQICSNPTFNSPEYQSNIFPGNEFSTNAITFPTGNIGSQLGSFPIGTQLWWRVGARYSGDNPGPLPSLGRANMRYMFSEPGNFFIEELPPGFP
ncbi:MAG: CsgG/HfaB family protein [Armatimonadota bacterium]|nr:CsgG/HfaB family protein [Armatimonadota bacterium]